jgi:hypothetical protein
MYQQKVERRNYKTSLDTEILMYLMSKHPFLFSVNTPLVLHSPEVYYE